MKPVSLDNIIGALDMQSEELGHYYDRKTGAIEMMMTADLAAAEDGANPEDFPEWQHASIKQAIEILEDSTNRFVELPSSFEIHDYSIMERFSLSFPDEEISAQLENAIRGRGAFRMFRDVIERLDVEDQWDDYRAERYSRIAREWCEYHDIPFTTG